MQSRWFRIEKEFPSLNDLLFNKKWTSAKLRKQFGALALMKAREANFRVTEPAFYTYLLCTPDNRKDPLNVGAGAIKIIEDGLVQGGAMPGDGRRWVLGHAFFVQTTVGQASVLVVATQLRCLTLAETLELEESWNEKNSSSGSAT